MKRQTHKKAGPRGKSGPRKTKAGDENLPLEFDRGWQELEAQHDRIKSDWMSLAAQMGINPKGKSGQEL